MNITLSADEIAFRDEVRAFLDAELPEHLREAGRNCTGIYSEYPEAVAWHRILWKRGWSVPHWPKEYGGTGWTAMQQYIFDLECRLAGAPEITPNATHMVAPVLMAFGTEEQKSFYLPRIASGEDWWAQGYSEPGSGSDLASLRCAAVADGDDYVINGSKIWTTHAHYSNRIFCLVRTRRSEKPQAGISFLIFDLDLPGITVRPLISISGEHEFNEVFFSDVRVPRSSLVGTENEGWSVAKYLLQHERAHCWSPLLIARMKRLAERLEAVRSSLDARHFEALQRRAAALRIRLTAFEIGELRMLASLSGGQTVSSSASSLNKIIGTELRQEITQLALEVESEGTIAAVGLRPDVNPARTYLNDRAASIYAGTNEVQRNIVAGALLRG